MKMYRIIIINICVLIASAVLLVGCGEKATGKSDIVRYEGKEYAFVEYPENIFHYDYNGNDLDNFEEVDGIYPIVSPKWEMIWNGGDLYCISDYIDVAQSYYADEENYEWYVQIDAEDEADMEEVYPIKVTEAELQTIYNLEEIEKNMSVFWEEFDMQGSIFKVSKDGVVRGTLSIAEYDGHWYWKSEMIDESREEDGMWPEYIQPLPESLDSKLRSIILQSYR